MEPADLGAFGPGDGSRRFARLGRRGAGEAGRPCDGVPAREAARDRELELDVVPGRLAHQNALSPKSDGSDPWHRSEGC
jgi:hypothetical protein